MKKVIEVLSVIILTLLSLMTGFLGGITLCITWFEKPKKYERTHTRYR